MAKSNARRQAEWRWRRNEAAEAWNGKPDEIASTILFRLGVKGAKKVAKTLDQRLRNIKPDCAACQGTGYVQMQATTFCGMPMGTEQRRLCNCSDDYQSSVREHGHVVFRALT
jgi:hypothetical protein